MRTTMMRWGLVVALLASGGMGAAQEPEPQEPTAATTAADSASVDSREKLISHWRKRQEELQRRLLKPTEVDFVETPLAEVLQFFAEECEIEFVLDSTALETLGLDSSLPITKQLRAVPLRTALDVVLGDHELTFFTRDGIIFVTSREAAEGELVTRVYNVASLLDASTPAESVAALVNVVVSIVQPASWQQQGGPGTIVSFRTTLVISQSERIHQAIENLLNELQKQTVTPSAAPE